MLYLKFALVAACLLAPATAASAKVLDFETGPGGAPTSAGNIAPDLFSDLGITLGTRGTTRPLALFDSDCKGRGCTGGDADLATGGRFGPAQDNVLIINERSSADPGDDPKGGTITFGFDRPVDIRSITFVDLDEKFLRKSLLEFSFVTASSEVPVGGEDLLALGGAVTLLNPSRPGNNSLRRIDFAGLSNLAHQDVTGFEVSLLGISAAIAAVEYTDGGAVAGVPLPPAMGLLLAGLGAIGIAARRRRPG